MKLGRAALVCAGLVVLSTGGLAGPAQAQAARCKVVSISLPSFFQESVEASPTGYHNNWRATVTGTKTFTYTVNCRSLNRKGPTQRVTTKITKSEPATGTGTGNGRTMAIQVAGWHAKEGSMYTYGDILIANVKIKRKG